MFRKERIQELITGRNKGVIDSLDGVNVYDEVPDDIWTRE
jgi:hypothetical protein